jgi:integrase
VVDERLGERVSKDYRQIIRRFLRFADGIVSKETIRGYLSSYLKKAPKTYNNQLDGLRAFVSRFLKRPDLMESFKKAYQPQDYEVELPTKEQVKKGFYGLTNDLEKGLYLFYATSGVRKLEALKLRSEDIDRKLRCVKPRHDTKTKRAGVTFYNEECAVYMDKIQDWDGKVFKIGSKRFREIWDKASEASGFRITPQVLRKWFSTTMGELGVPDRYVDIFQGRVPKSVLAKYYTGKELKRLKRVYERANLRVLN